MGGGGGGGGLQFSLLHEGVSLLPEAQGPPVRFFIGALHSNHCLTVLSEFAMVLVPLFCQELSLSANAFWVK
jgi:hypothetical protein